MTADDLDDPRVEAVARVFAAGGWDAPNEGADCEPDDVDYAVARAALKAADAVSNGGNSGGVPSPIPRSRADESR